MKRRRVWQYMCDHCDKKSCSASHLSVHEKSCTGNPNRVCRICRMANNNQPSIRKLLAAIAKDVAAAPVGNLLVEVSDLPRTSKAAKGCHACMLAAVRIAGEIYGCGVWFSWSYDKAKKSFWKAYHKRSEIF